MPIYEFYCGACHTLFNFFSSRINTSAVPACPKCRKALARQISLFSTIGRAREEDEGVPDIDEGRLSRVMGDLAREAETVGEDDPQQMARIMRRFSEQAGMALGSGMEEALRRLEAGESPEVIEQEMGDLLENEEPFTLLAKKGRSKSGRPAPSRDETLYEL